MWILCVIARIEIALIKIAVHVYIICIFIEEPWTYDFVCDCTHRGAAE